MQVNSNTGEVIKSTGFRTIKRENVSKQSVGSSKVVCYDFVNTYEPGPSGTKEDYRVVKKPKKIDEYDIKKVMVERCKGCDLKSIVARMEKTGDISLLNQRNVEYGDARKIPANRSDAFQKGVESSKFLDKLSASEKEQLIAMAKDPEKFAAYVAEHQKKEKKDVKPVEKTDVNVEKKGDQENG